MTLIRIWENDLMEDLRVGFLGAGGFATHTIYPALHFAPLVLKAICDMDVEKADRNAKKLEVVQTFMPTGIECTRMRIWKRL